jgi:hypothetical protein
MTNTIKPCNQLHTAYFRARFYKEIQADCQVGDGIAGFLEHANMFGKHKLNYLNVTILEGIKFFWSCTRQHPPDRQSA